MACFLHKNSGTAIPLPQQFDFYKIIIDIKTQVAIYSLNEFCFMSKTNKTCEKLQKNVTVLSNFRLSADIKAAPL
jgi:hypothetical protein